VVAVGRARVGRHHDVLRLGGTGRGGDFVDTVWDPSNASSNPNLNVTIWWAYC
jgi:hypothetical protein